MTIGRNLDRFTIPAVVWCVVCHAGGKAPGTPGYLIGKRGVPNRELRGWCLRVDCGMSSR